MREICTYGSVRGVAGDRHPYRDPHSSLFKTLANRRSRMKGRVARIGSSIRVCKHLHAKETVKFGFVFCQPIFCVGRFRKSQIGFVVRRSKPAWSRECESLTGKE